MVFVGSAGPIKAVQAAGARSGDSLHSAFTPSNVRPPAPAPLTEPLRRYQQAAVLPSMRWFRIAGSRANGLPDLSVLRAVPLSPDGQQTGRRAVQIVASETSNAWAVYEWPHLPKSRFSRRAYGTSARRLSVLPLEGGRYARQGNHDCDLLALPGMWRNLECYQSQVLAVGPPSRS